MNITKLDPRRRGMPHFHFEYVDEQGEAIPPAERSKLSGKPDVIIVRHYESPDAAEARLAAADRPGVSWDGGPTEAELARERERIEYSPGSWVGLPPGVAIETAAVKDGAEYAPGKWTGTPPGVAWE